ncbi:MULTISPECIES: glycosyltransferase family 2 protein [Cupriavidus]
MPPELSVVVPSYGCLGCLTELCDRLHAVLTGLGSSFEILLVDDRSPDNSWPLIESLAGSYPAVRGIRLSRNFGQHVAITAGLAAARGQYVVVMDCDLQDPPERIPDLLAELRKGYDFVLARRATRSHSAFRQVSAKLYFRLINALTGESVDGSYGTFSILTRKVVDAFLLFGERERHYLFILRWLGFRSGTVEYAHAERHAGESSYNVLRLLKHALSGIFFQTSVFLTWIIYAGLFFTALSFLGGCFFIYRHFTADSLPGWTSLVVAILFSTGMILASIGAVGLYVSRVFEMAKGRPIYVVDRECGCGSTAVDASDEKGA